MRFSEIYGHEKNIAHLCADAESGRVSHAYLFEGIHGVGKLSAALAFAAALVCENPHGGESCGDCHGCLMCGAGSHPDVKVVTNEYYGIEKKSDVLAVETIREMKKEIYLKPYIADRKIYIIRNAETMTEQAQNSLLKVLEEPPAYCTLILLCEKEGSLLPTIISRVVKLAFSPLPENEVGRFLREEKGLSERDADLFAKMSGGSCGHAAELSEDGEFTDVRNNLAEHLLRLVESGKNAVIYDFSKYLKSEKSRSDRLFEILEALLRDIMLICCGSDFRKIVNSDISDKLSAICKRISTKISVEFFEIFDKYRSFAAHNVSYNTAVHCMVMEWWEKLQ